MEGRFFPMLTSHSPTSNEVLFSDVSESTRTDVFTLDLSGELRPEVFLQTPFDETWAAFSRDGNWVAYQSDESGRYEIYVRPYPGPGGRWQVSTHGGTHPLWSPTRDELFYWNDGKMMSARYEATAESFRSSRGEELFAGPYVFDSFNRGFDITPDGERFIMLESAANQDASKLVLVLNWFEELKRLVPTND